MSVFMETERLILRDWLEEDKIRFAEMNSDDEMMRYFPNKLTRDESDAMVDRIVGRLTAQDFGLWAVEVKATGEFIGFIGFAYPSFEEAFTPCIEIGWRLHKDCWKKGYATEGAMACLDYGFKELDFEVIHSFTSRINEPSIGVMKKIGLRYDRDFMHPSIDKDNPLCQHVLYRLDREEWRRNHER